MVVVLLRWKATRFRYINQKVFLFPFERLCFCYYKRGCGVNKCVPMEKDTDSL